MVVFDATTLLVLLAPDAVVPTDSQGKPIQYARERLSFFLGELTKNRIKVIIPTPALSEVLVRATPAAAAEYIKQIQKAAAFRIEAFDERAAIEVAAMTRHALEAGDKRGGGSGSWAKIKYDRQIIAIARVSGASAIYSDDEGVQRFGRLLGMTVRSIADLQIPDSVAQMSLLPGMASDVG